MRTLADMTPQERARCRGMWCVDKTGPLCIYMGDNSFWDGLGICTYPASPITLRANLKNLIPRPDLPRAWAPDGTPPAGEWEYAERLSMGVTAVYLCGKENPTHRQWIGKWEEA